MNRISQMEPHAFRHLVAQGLYTEQTSGICPGFVQANLVAVPALHADAFERFAAKNPAACPLLDRIGPGKRESALFAPGADLARAFPRYHIARAGLIPVETIDAAAWWREDLVAFLIGCSFTFESALIQAGIPMRHIEAGTNVAMYVTSMMTQPSGAFSGPLVVSMRAIRSEDVTRVREITGRYPAVHGAPIHAGDPDVLGIADLGHPDFGDPIPIRKGEIPVFWPCGVTSRLAALRAGLDLTICHSPGHMLVTDVLNETLEVTE